jgi:hypothetical protein
MKPFAPCSDVADNPPPGMPNDTVRTIVSLALFIHLFCVGIAVITNNDGSRSQLLFDIRQKTRFIDGYLTQLWLNRAYNYYLMNDENWDSHIEATINFADGHTERPVVIPDPSLGPGERRQRYQFLADFMAQQLARSETDQADPELKLLVPESIGAGLISSHPGAETVSFKCVFHQGISREALQSSDPQERDPSNSRYFVAIPNGNPTVLLDHGRPTVFEGLPAAEVSPIKGGSAPKLGGKKEERRTSPPASAQ